MNSVYKNGAVSTQHGKISESGLQIRYIQYDMRPSILYNFKTEFFVIFARCFKHRIPYEDNYYLMYHDCPGPCFGEFVKSITDFDKNKTD